MKRLFSLLCILGIISQLTACSSRSSEESRLTVNALYKMGRAKYEQKLFEEALRDFSRARTLDPKNMDVEMQYALALFEVGEEAKAIETLKTLCERMQNSPSCFASLSYLSFRDKDYQKSILYADRALTDPTFTFKHQALLTKGASYLQLRQLKKSLEILQKSISNQAGQNSCLNRMLLSRAYLMLGRFKEAISEAKLGRSLCVSSFETYEWLAYAQYKSAEFNSATNTYVEARTRFKDPRSQAVINQNISRLKQNEALAIPEIVL